MEAVCMMAEMQKTHANVHNEACNITDECHGMLCDAHTGSIQQRLTAKVQGLNARCMSNLIWALVKLEVTDNDGHPLAKSMVITSSPLVIELLEECSGQV
jgi:hypothetical protein